MSFLPRVIFYHWNSNNNHLQYVLQKNVIDKAESHPELKEKSIKEGDLFAHVCGMKEPRGSVRVLGQSITPQDLRT